MTSVLSASSHIPRRAPSASEIESEIASCTAHYVEYDVSHALGQQQLQCDGLCVPTRSHKSEPTTFNYEPTESHKSEPAS